MSALASLAPPRAGLAIDSYRTEACPPMEGSNCRSGAGTVVKRTWSRGIRSRWVHSHRLPQWLSGRALSLACGRPTRQRGVLLRTIRHLAARTLKAVLGNEMTTANGGTRNT